MKVTFEKDYKRLLTLEEYDIAKRIIASMKEDESTPAEYAEYAVNAIGRAYGIFGCAKVYECSAEIAKNARARDAYDGDSRNLDIWLSGYARTLDGFIKFGAYLTDIWNLDGDNNEDIAKYNMYKEIFKRAEI